MVASAPAQNRHLFVFRMRPAAVSAHLAGVAALGRVIQSMGSQAQLWRPEREGHASIGSLESEMYRLVMMVPLASGPQTGLANVAVTPDRQILGILLVSDNPITARDRRLIQAFSQTVSYDGGSVAPEPAPEPGAPSDDIDAGEDAPSQWSHLIRPGAV
jgi:hypothetical protein